MNIQTAVKRYILECFYTFTPQHEASPLLEYILTYELKLTTAAVLHYE